MLSRIFADLSILKAYCRFDRRTSRKHYANYHQKVRAEFRTTSALSLPAVRLSVRLLPALTGAV